MEKVIKPSDKYRKMPYLALWCYMCASLKEETLKEQGFKNGFVIEELYPFFCSELNSEEVFSVKFNERELLKDYFQVRNTPVADWVLVAEAMFDVFSENIKKKESPILVKGLILSELLLINLKKEIKQSKNFLQKRGFNI